MCHYKYGIQYYGNKLYTVSFKFGFRTEYADLMEFRNSIYLKLSVKDTDVGKTILRENKRISLMKEPHDV